MFCCFRPPAVLEQTGSLDNSSKMTVAKEKPCKAADRVAMIMVCDEACNDGSEAANAVQDKGHLPATNSSPLLKARLAKSSPHRTPAALDAVAKVVGRQHSADASTPTSRPGSPAGAAPVPVSSHSPVRHSAFPGHPATDATLGPRTCWLPLRAGGGGVRAAGTLAAGAVATQDQAKQQGVQEEEEDVFVDACEEFVSRDDSVSNKNDSQKEFVDACEDFAPVAASSACTAATGGSHSHYCWCLQCRGWQHKPAVEVVRPTDALPAQAQQQQEQPGAQEENGEEIKGDEVPWWRGLSTAEILCAVAPKHMADLGRRSTAEILSVIAPNRVVASAAASWRWLNVIAERPTEDSVCESLSAWQPAMA